MDLDAVLLRDFDVPEPPPTGDLGMLKFGGGWYAPIGSGVMIWRAPLTEPYTWFEPIAGEAMKALPGDQEGIIAAIVGTGHRIIPIPGVSAQLFNGPNGIQGPRPPGTIWCTAGNGPKSWEVDRPWIPKLK